MKKLEIPTEYVELCEAWHGGQSSMFYAISSTGALSLGTHNPYPGESDEVWMLGLMESTISEIEECIEILQHRINHCQFTDEDATNLDLFEGFLSYMEIKKAYLERNFQCQ